MEEASNSNVERKPFNFCVNGPKGETPLTIAVSEGLLEICQAIYENGGFD